MNEKTLRMAYLALFAALTLVLGYLEATIPVPVTIPGVKLGLANVTVVIALYLMGPRWAAGVMLLKVAVTSLLIGSPSMIAYSLAGSTLAFLGLLAVWRSRKIGLVGASVVAALLHNVGQLLAAVAIMQTPALFMNLPVMVIAACIMGTITGTVATGALKALPSLANARVKHPATHNATSTRS